MNPPTDIRQRVDDDRGILKRLQLLVPGFRGYREGEDLREADSVLRLQVADKIHAAAQVVAKCRQDLASAGRFDSLNDLALALSDLTRLEGEVRHAEQGYTGISPALRVGLPGQEKLYEYDYGFVLAAEELRKSVAGLPSAAADPATTVSTVREMITKLELAFRARIEVIEGATV